MNVVTTLPSATEIVCALGIEPSGVSHGCDYPPGVEEFPSITASRVDASASAGEIDRQVLETTAEGEGVYAVDTGTLDDLSPDLIVTQGMCDVCAVDEALIERAVEEIDADPDVLTTDPHGVEDVLGDVERIGRATGREGAARDLVDDLVERIEAVRSVGRDGAASDDANAVASRPRTVVFDWTDPVMVAGHWMPELVAWAGGEYGMAEPGDASTPREWADVRAYDPDVIVLAPCGFGLEQTAANLSDLTDRAGWDALTAVRDGRVYAMDGNHLANRPGPRVVDTLSHLAPMVRPDLFEPAVAPGDAVAETTAGEAVPATARLADLERVLAA